MHYFRTPKGEEVDLDDPKTYSSKYWKKFKTSADLKEEAESKLGKALFYMEFHRPEWYETENIQKARVKQFCFWFANEWSDHMGNTEDNKLWFRKFIYRLDDETENMC